MNPATPKELFESLPSKLDKDAADDLDAVYQFDLTGAQGGRYQVLVKNGVCTVKEGAHADPHVTLSLDGDDCIRLLNGQLSGFSIAMSGRLQITGDISLAIQLKSLFPTVGR
ncbi:MAG: SCP2 sterol-binding domain-containing protein [Nitrospira sp.]|nr:SCP2 sterol-binding domain-containing protein [Nitrospira sp.]MDH4236011.1 SCP2 sterol-binding domain-containing protein [Nitrospira sp.]MDH4329733.1 SCP2 sterol-binding domain-containing protein [Nitrospira sp.]MDH5252463.1 SCP2 sterol-binding domain-containing protein [Nitrospira sp.]MDH5625692.1 SCP2 sterol-binding domain-containing protein [Nitrospira sp.]